MDSQPISEILKAIRRGEEGARQQLFEAVYQELRRLASRRMVGESPGHTLQPTALVHETYLRLMGQEDCQWVDRAHFFASAGEAMRRILVEEARRKRGPRRGGGRPMFSIRDDDAAVESPSPDLLALDEALSQLEAQDPRKSIVVKCRYFLQMSIEETAEALGVSPSTVSSDWNLAKAWLHAELSKGDTEVDS